MLTNAVLTWTSVLRHALTMLVHTLVTVQVDGLWIMMVTTAMVNIYSYAWEKLMIVQKVSVECQKILVQKILVCSICLCVQILMSVLMEE